MTASDWDQQVARFGVDGLADQLASVGASYFFLTIGQNSGHFCAPNSTYDDLVGIQQPKCSQRDLISDLHDSLHPRGIALLVYLPAGAPAQDDQAVQTLEREWGSDGN
jgi:hypothetical protein